MREKIQR